MRILLVEDERLVREALAELVLGTFPGASILQSGSITDAAKQIASNEPLNLMILDLQVAGADTTESLAGFVQICSNIPILVLADEVSWPIAVGSIDIGVKGIVVKTGKASALVKAISTIFAGDNMDVPAAPRGFIPTIPGSNGDRVHARRVLGGLSDREYDVATLVATGLINREIGTHLKITEGTVKLHIAKVFEKAKARNRGDLVRLVFNARSGVKAD